MQAALGLCQLRGARLRSSSAGALLAERYTAALERIPYLEAPYDPPYAHAHMAVLLRAGRPGAPLERTELMRRLLDDGIATRRGVMAIHEEASYAALGGRPRRRPAPHRGGGPRDTDAAAVPGPHRRAAGLRDRATGAHLRKAAGRRDGIPPARASLAPAPSRSSPRKLVEGGASCGRRHALLRYGGKKRQRRAAGSCRCRPPTSAVSARQQGRRVLLPSRRRDGAGACEQRRAS